MAYTATNTVEHLTGEDGERVFRVTISETECAAASETSFVLPVAGHLRPVKIAQMYRVQCVKASGSATTVQPRLGSAAAATGVQIQFLATAGASVDEQPAAPTIIYGTSTGTFYHRSQPDTGSDNSITTVYLIEEGV